MNNPLLLNSANTLNIKLKLQEAFEKNFLALLYQPIISLKNKKIKEIEVFFSYLSVNNTIVNQAEIELALQGENELAFLLIEWMLTKAIEDFKQWQYILLWSKNKLYNDEIFKIRFRLLEQQLLLPNFMPKIVKLIDNSGISNKIITLEIPESLIENNIIQGETIVRKLKDLGFCLSISSSNTEYLCLDNQNIFLFDNLKISSPLQSRQQKIITKKILELTRILDITVTAANIETSFQLKLWENLECDFGTGKIFSLPVNSQKIANLIASNHLFSN